MDVFEMLRLATEALEAIEVSYFVTGSMATIAFGEPRLTIDVDIVADLKRSHVGALCDAFAAPDFYCSRAMIVDAIRHRSQFNIIHPFSGVKVDVMVPADSAFNRSRLDRRVVVTTRGVRSFFASPEDAILKKLEYYRDGGSEKHVRDIKGVLLIQGDAIDFDYLNEWAKVLDVVEQLRAIVAEL